MYKYISLLLVIFFTSLSAKIPIGEFSNISGSRVTGDIGGFKLNLKKENEVYSGEIAVAAGDFTAPVLLENLKCEEKKDTCSFRFKHFDRKKNCTIIAVTNSFIFNCPDGDESIRNLLTPTNKEIVSKDLVTFAKGKMYKSASKKSKVLKVLPLDSEVNFIDVHDKNDTIFMEINFNGQKGFVEYENLYDSQISMIIGDKVRFRSSPNTDAKILLEFKKGTIVGGIDFRDPEWARVIYKGKLGYVAKEYIVPR